ncbi:hypothetical protein SKAU_G00189390 [Synaphobranchus kaupii]|uniref:Uncharacterized protein n=1 Tax=Synaphobranchus kaupii TaxID=118154 RepID=A0A9Q1FD50_SYNKA|nr:hypothetical protein SKAU_G00189390 [Synaphobranchus kaupii]
MANEGLCTEGSASAAAGRAGSVLAPPACCVFRRGEICRRHAPEALSRCAKPESTRPLGTRLLPLESAAGGARDGSERHRAGESARPAVSFASPTTVRHRSAQKRQAGPKKPRTLTLTVSVEVNQEACHIRGQDHLEEVAFCDRSSPPASAARSYWYGSSAGEEALQSNMGLRMQAAENTLPWVKEEKEAREGQAGRVRRHRWSLGSQMLGSRCSSACTGPRAMPRPEEERGASVCASPQTPTSCQPVQFKLGCQRWGNTWWAPGRGGGRAERGPRTEAEESGQGLRDRLRPPSVERAGNYGEEGAQRHRAICQRGGSPRPGRDPPGPPAHAGGSRLLSGHLIRGASGSRPSGRPVTGETRGDAGQRLPPGPTTPPPPPGLSSSSAPLRTAPCSETKFSAPQARSTRVCFARRLFSSLSLCLFELDTVLRQHASAN